MIIKQNKEHTMKISRRYLRKLIKEVMSAEEAPESIVRVRDFIDYLGEFDPMTPIFISRDSGGDNINAPVGVRGVANLEIGRFAQDDDLDDSPDSMDAICLFPADVVGLDQGPRPESSFGAGTREMQQGAGVGTREMQQSMRSGQTFDDTW